MVRAAQANNARSAGARQFGSPTASELAVDGNRSERRTKNEERRTATPERRTTELVMRALPTIESSRFERRRCAQRIEASRSTSPFHRSAFFVPVLRTSFFVLCSLFFVLCSLFFVLCSL